MLRRLRLVFARALQIRNERHVDEQAVLLSLLQRYLSDRLQERLALDIAYRAADLRYYHVRVARLAYVVYEFLDLVSDVRYHLHGAAEIFTFSLLVEHVPVDLARRQVRIFVQIFIYETFIVSEVEVCLRSVLRDEHLSMLIRTHRPGVHVYIRIQLLCRDTKSPRLEQPAQRRRCDSLSESRNDSTCYKYILFHAPHLLSLINTYDFISQMIFTI